MKFQLKALVAALALVAVAAPAQATIANSATGSSSLILTLLDNAANVSASFDLGYDYNSFAESIVTSGPSAANINWNLSSDVNYASAWNSFTAVANLSTAHWAIFAGDNTVPGGKGMIVTYSTLPATNVLNSELNTQLGNFDTYLTGPIAGTVGGNAALGNHSIVANGADFTTNANANAYAGSAKAYNLDGKVGTKGPVTWGNFDQSLGVVKLSLGTSRVVSDVYANSVGASSFTMGADGALVFAAPVAAVPEADTSAMMLIGLGLMGFVSRRRKNVA